MAESILDTQLLVGWLVQNEALNSHGDEGKDMEVTWEMVSKAYDWLSRLAMENDSDYSDRRTRRGRGMSSSLSHYESIVEHYAKDAKQRSMKMRQRINGVNKKYLDDLDDIRLRWEKERRAGERDEDERRRKLREKGIGDSAEARKKAAEIARRKLVRTVIRKIPGVPG